MADNVVSAVSIPVYLQGISLGFRMQGLLADRLSPRIPVMFQSAKYRVWGRDVFREHDATWVSGTTPNEIGMGMSSQSYLADERKLRTPVFDSELANNGTPEMGGIDIKGRRTQLVTQAIQIAREKRVANLFTNSSNYNSGNIITKTSGNEYNQSGKGGQQVLDDINALAAVIAQAAMVPQEMLSVVVPTVVWNQSFKYNTAALDAIKYSQTGIMTQDLFASVLGVKEVIPAFTQTLGAGPATAGADIITGNVPTYLWGDTIWVGLIGDNAPTEDNPAFSRSFNWTRASGGQERQIKEYRDGDEGKETTWIECKEAIDEEIVFKDAGGIIVNASSTI